MTSQQSIKAIQLIAFNSDKNPYLTPQALALLPTLQSNNLHIIAVAGKYRTGKSYILNRVLLNKSSGFNVGHTINACTKGLWMWPELIKLEDKDCLIIDTQGLGSLQEGESTDLKIFLLALLFSSHLIYNSTGSIDEQAIESLSLVIQLANVLQRQDRYDTQELVNTFPSFLWLIRDFSLKLEDQKGKPITPTDYLQQALRHQPKSSPAAERKNQIRKQLRTFFQQRDCFALVRPTQEERDLQNLSSLHQSRLRPEFVQLIKDLRSKLSANVKPKRVRGRVLNTEGFVQLCKYYTKALVDGKLPTISSHWDNLCLGQTHRIFQKFQLQHIQALQQAGNDKKQLQNVHRTIMKIGIEAIQKSFLGKLEKQLFKQRFQRKLEQQFNQLKMRLNTKKGSELKNILQNLDEVRFKQGDIIQKFQAVIQKMSQISQTYNRDQSFYCQLYLYISELARNLLQQAESKRFEQQKILNQKMIFFQDQINQLKKQQSSRQKEDQQVITSLRKIINQTHSYSYQQLTDKQQKYTTQIMQLKQIVKSLKQQEEILTNKLRKSQLINEEIKQIIHKNKKENSNLQENIHQKQIQLAKKEELLREQVIKSRKLLREKDIVKHRYEEYLQQNLSLRNLIDQYQHKIIILEKKQRYVSQGEIFSESEQLIRALRKSQEERKSLIKLLNDQRSAYQVMMQSPQNLSLAAIKRNLQLQQQQRESLQIRLCDVSKVFRICQYFQCLFCKQTLSGRLLRDHSKRCVGKEQFQFDVSYNYTTEGKLYFQIEIENGNKQWIVTKTLSQLQQLLLHFDQQDTYIVQRLFQQTEEEITQSHINKNQERRIKIDQVLHQIKDQIQEDHFLLNYLNIKDQVNNEQKSTNRVFGIQKRENNMESHHFDKNSKQDQSSEKNN